MANPNPSPETRFQPGNPGGGKTSEQKRMEYEAAEMSAKIRHRLLSVITDKMDTAPDAMPNLTSELLRLLKDSEDRAHGTPKATVAGAGEGGEHLLTYVIRDMTKDA